MVGPSGHATHSVQIRIWDKVALCHSELLRGQPMGH
eukprot:CAMPEP_0195059564 /NCGR_PEP_ID=MMETSP0448-20130528/7022_1 /TAXON_ID=66468 /ORGANISM="Heterocapsa triquestra, Strain CCMP 448" /LENGTH=35 /DNA_ID= /DNA_START= /DNA_END= /DNA_ORIENTATION=